MPTLGNNSTSTVSAYTIPSSQVQTVAITVTPTHDGWIDTLSAYVNVLALPPSGSIGLEVNNGSGYNSAPGSTGAQTVTGSMTLAQGAQVVYAGTAYQLQVVARNAIVYGQSYGIWDIWANETLAVAPSAPAAPTLTENTASPWNMTVTWAAPAGIISSYEIDRSPDNITFTAVGTVANSVLTFTDVGVPTGTLYYRIKAINTEASATGAVATFAAPTTTGAPTLAQPLGTQQVNLTWTPVTQLGHQKIERSPNGSTGWVTIVDNLPPGQTSYTDFSVAATTTYYYRVDATNSVSTTTGTVSAPITTTAALMATTLTGVYPGPNNPLEVVLSWTALPTGTPTYTPQRSTTNNGADWASLSGAQTATTYTDATVTQGVLYYYRISASTGAFGPTVAIYAPGPGVPAAPKLAQNPFFPARVDIWWSPVPSFLLAVYAVERSPHGAGTWSVLASNIYGCWWEDTLTAPGSYDYRILSADSPPGVTLPFGGYQNVGPLATITVNVLPPWSPGLTQTAGTQNVVINWAAPPGGATTYTVQQSTDGGVTWGAVVAGLTATTYTVTGRTAYTRYWYRIVAVTGGSTANGPARSIFIDTSAAIVAGYRVILGGADVSANMLNPTPKVDRQSSSSGAQATFTLHYEPGPSAVVQGSVVAVFFGRELRFYGFVVDAIRKPVAAGVEDVDVKARDATLALEGAYVTETFEQLQLGQIISLLAAIKLPGITTNGIQAGPFLSAAVFSQEQLMAGIRRMISTGAAQAASPVFRVTPDMDLELSFGAPSAASIVLTDHSTITNTYP